MANTRPEWQQYEHIINSTQKSQDYTNMKIKFGNDEYALKYSLRAFMLFEQMLSKPFNVETLTDTYVLFYCFLMASNKPFDITFEQYMDLLDENPETVREFNKWFAEETARQAQITNPEKPKKGAKKARS